jgi:ubiquinone biosynthesis protein Coq4
MPTNTNEIQRTIKQYFQNLYSCKLGNIDEIDTFLDAYNQPKLNQEDINHLNRPITNRDIHGFSPYKEEPRT